MTMRLASHHGTWFTPLRALEALWPSSDHPISSRPEQTQLWMGRFSQAGWLGGARQPRPARVGAAAHHLATERGTKLVVRSHANGLRISGRMQDVCAELERLALLETAQDARALRH
jgi:hypothetical protein